MVYKAHSRLRRTKMMKEALKSAILMRHAGVESRGVQRIEIRERIPAARKTFQIRSEHLGGLGPALADEIELVRFYVRKLETSPNCVLRETGIMLDTADALF